MNNGMTKVGLYGIGHFGYAILRLLEEKAGTELDVCGYDRSEKVRATLQTERRHPTHAAPGPLSSRVSIVDSVDDLMSGLDILVLAVSSNSTREVVQNIIEAEWPDGLIMVNTAKALDYVTGSRLSCVVGELMANYPKTCPYVALSGATVASELLWQNPLGMTLGSEDHSVLPRVKRIFSSPMMWVQTTDDLIGVEYAGAFKNVIAICAGMARGLGLSYGAETHLISRMAEEIELFCVNKLGASPRTFSIGSQCWGCDLWMSCTGSTRNRTLGELIGQGQTLNEANEIMTKQNKTVEGVQTLRALVPILREYPEDLRLLGVADKVVMNAESPQMLIDELMRDNEES